MDINVIWAPVISGAVPVTPAILDSIWQDYKKIFPNLNSQSIEHRQANLQEGLEYIILNNKNPSHTFTKGINVYTQMSDQEFNDYWAIPDKWPESVVKEKCSKSFQFMQPNRMRSSSSRKDRLGKSFLNCSIPPWYFASNVLFSTTKLMNSSSIAIGVKLGSFRRT